MRFVFNNTISEASKTKIRISRTEFDVNQLNKEIKDAQNRLS